MKRLRKWQNKFGNAKRFILNPLAKKEQDRAKDRIRRTKVDPRNRNWSRWSQSTLESRRRKGNVSYGLLYDTGALHNSIRTSVTNNTMYIGSGLDYAEYLQMGTYKMDARPFLGVSNETEDDFVDLLSNIIER